MNDVTYAAGQVVSNGREIGSRLLDYVEEWGPRLLAVLVILLIGWLAARDQMASGQAGQPHLAAARAQFIHERPFTAAALGGVLGIALINTLRGK